MRKIIVLLLSLGVLSTLENCELLPYMEDEGMESNFKVRKETFHINSNALKGNLFEDPVKRNVSVYLPIAYDFQKKSRFPVIYIMHGQPLGETTLEDKSAWMEFEELYINTIPIFQKGVDFPEQGFVPWLTGLMKSKIIEPTIIVVPDMRTSYLLSYGTNSELHGDMEDFIINELVSKVDKKYRTKTDAKYRGIVGHCVGGYGALRLGIKYPEVFSHVGSMSPVHITQPGVEMSIPMLKMENPDGLSGPHPLKFFTNGFYGAAAAWSPNPDNPDLVDMPFDLVSGEIVLPIMSIWEMNSIFAFINIYSSNFDQLRTLYFDCGQLDELGSVLPNDALHQSLTLAGKAHVYETYDGFHISNFYNRLEIVLGYLSTEMSD